MSPRLDVTVTTDARPRARVALRTETNGVLRRMLGLEVDLGRFYRSARQRSATSAS